MGRRRFVDKPIVEIGGWVKREGIRQISAAERGNLQLVERVGKLNKNDLCTFHDCCEAAFYTSKSDLFKIVLTLTDWRKSNLLDKRKAPNSIAKNYCMHIDGVRNDHNDKCVQSTDKEATADQNTHEYV